MNWNDRHLIIILRNDFSYMITPLHVNLRGRRHHRVTQRRREIALGLGESYFRINTVTFTAARAVAPPPSPLLFGHL